jgi:Flp pilus assembly protein CpaB
VEAAPDRLRRSAEQRRNGGGDDATRRVVGRRRALPSARAVVGGVLMGAAALVVFAGVMDATRGGATRDFAVAARPLPAGSLIQPDDLSMSAMHLPPGAAGSAFADPARLVGRTVAVPLAAGELIESSVLAAAGSTAAVRPVTVAVDPATLGSLIAGQPVDVLEAAGDQGSTGVSVVLRGATLLAVSRSSSGLLSNPSAAVVTLGVSTLDEVEAVIAASHSGTLTLVAAEPSDGVGPGPGSPAGG